MGSAGPARDAGEKKEGRGVAWVGGGGGAVDGREGGGAWAEQAEELSMTSCGGPPAVSADVTWRPACAVASSLSMTERSLPCLF